MGNVGEIEEMWPSSSNLNSSLSFCLSLNHVSYVCKSLIKSVRFYQDVLGFVLIKRPSSFDFQGAWLFNYGIGIHLLESEDENVTYKKGVINPKENHISFQCSDMILLQRKLEEMGIEYVTAIVEEGGVIVDQLFFHDPDGYMIEICNCENLPVLPISSCSLKIPKPNTTSLYERRREEKKCSMEVATQMMENLMLEMISFSI